MIEDAPEKKEFCLIRITHKKWNETHAVNSISFKKFHSEDKNTNYSCMTAKAQTFENANNV